MWLWNGRITLQVGIGDEEGIRAPVVVLLKMMGNWGGPVDWGDRLTEFNKAEEYALTE